MRLLVVFILPIIGCNLPNTAIQRHSPKFIVLSYEKFPSIHKPEVSKQLLQRLKELKIGTDELGEIAQCEHAYLVHLTKYAGHGHESYYFDPTSSPASIKPHAQRINNDRYSYSFILNIEYLPTELKFGRHNALKAAKYICSTEYHGMEIVSTIKGQYANINEGIAAQKELEKQKITLSEPTFTENVFIFYAYSSFGGRICKYSLEYKGLELVSVTRNLLDDNYGDDRWLYQ